MFLSSVSDSEVHLEYLGQRMVIGYDSFNFYRNIGSLSILLVIYFAKMIILGLVLKPMTCISKHKKVRKMYRSVYNQVFFDDIFLLLLWGYFEFGMGICLNYSAPTSSEDHDGDQLLVSTIVFVCIFVVMPLVY